MIFTPYLALLAALRFGVVLLALVALYGAWLMVHDMIWPTDAPEGDE